MKAEALVEALRELEGRGWPCKEYRTDKDSSAWELTNAEDGSRYMSVFHYGDGQPGWVDRSVLQGCLVSQVEARGLRREVELGPVGDRWTGVLLFEDDDEEPMLFRTADTELEALIAACLSLHTEAAGGGTNES
jgi:hypothetical protein